MRSRISGDSAAEWKPAGLFAGGKATISGLTPGSTVWVRVRTVGLKSVMGAWSAAAKIMVGGDRRIL